ncbi:MAG: RidA family protein [Thermodesulfovibrionales bacterium]
MSYETRVKELGIELPEAAKPLGSYVPCVRTGNLLFLSGILPLRAGKLIRTGRVGEALSLEEAQQDARQIVINALAVIRSHLGNLDAVSRCVKLNGFVASGPGFTGQPAVLNAASDLLFEIFGEAGRHARAAVGVYGLPLDAPLEIDFIFEVKQ